MSLDKDQSSSFNDILNGRITPVSADKEYSVYMLCCNCGRDKWNTAKFGVLLDKTCDFCGCVTLVAADRKK